MRTLFRISILLGLTAAFGSFTPDLARAEAAPSRRNRRPEPRRKNELDSERLRKSLEGDEAQALAALDELSAVSPEQRPQAAELVNQVLGRGGNVKILLRAPRGRGRARPGELEPRVGALRQSPPGGGSTRRGSLAEPDRRARSRLRAAFGFAR